MILAIDELRELAHGIHPQVLTDAGLASAIRQLAARSTVPITLGELPSTRLDDIAEATAYYLVAEALTNAQKHAHATSLRVHATTTARTLRLEIVDDGVGGATEPARVASWAYATVSRRSAAPSPSTAPTVTEPGSPPPSPPGGLLAAPATAVGGEAPREAMEFAPRFRRLRPRRPRRP